MKNSLITLMIFMTCVLSAQDKNKIKGRTLSNEIRIHSGIVRGYTEEDVSVFKGIPYAAPPVGEFRWRPPQPVAPWDGVHDALEFGPDCAQAGWGAAPGTISEGSSEDCLYLNLWVPADRTTDAKLPVMVWIHGGGFTGGSGSGAQTQGTKFAKKDIILITFNYRLGRLGHFAFPALSEEHPNEPKGSYAYMDQIAALQWVKKNIAAFGGDPNNVTIFGFSAGGVSVHSLMTMQAARGLFQKAISESGGGRDGVLTGRPIREENTDPLYPISAETIGINFARKNGIEGIDKGALAKLRALSAQEIVDGGQETDGEGGPRIYPGPILDGKLVVETAESAYKAGRQAKVPLIIGSNSAEIGGGFVNASASKEELFSLFGVLADKAKAAYDPNGEKEFAEVITKFNTDWVWAEPGRMVARAFVKNGVPAYYYQFGYVPEALKERMKYGAGHGSEVAYVFNNPDARWGGLKVTSEDEKVAEMMNAYWSNFVKTGDPNGESLPHWPVYSNEKNEILDVESDGNAHGRPDPRQARLDVIEKAMKFRADVQTRAGI
jgi:para-nitrobenzyl esterase